MAENKTQPTKASVEGYLLGIADEARRKDCRALIKLMTRVTKAKPVMWGPSIVGFGSYHYTYASGREGDMCAVGFAARKSDLTVYLMGDFPGRETLFKKLGKYKSTTACVYIKKLDDIDVAVLEKLVQGAVKAITTRYEKRAP